MANAMVIFLRGIIETFVNDGFIQNGDFQQREITETMLPN